MTIVSHAFELRPEPVPQPDPGGDYIQSHWRRSVRPLAADRGLAMEIPPRPSRSRRALEAAFFALDHDRYRDVHLGIFRAYFEAGQDIADVGVLARIAERAGLDPAALRQALEDDTYAARVRDDIELAVSLGIGSVPTMLVAANGDDLGAAEPVVGAVPYDWLEGAITRALSGDRSHARARRRFRADLPVVEQE